MLCWIINGFLLKLKEILYIKIVQTKAKKWIINDFIFWTPDESMVVALSQQPDSKSAPVPPAKSNLTQAANKSHFKADLGKKRPAFCWRV